MAIGMEGTVPEKAPPKTPLQELTSELQDLVYKQHNLLRIAKKYALDQEYAPLEALTISIDRFNDDIFELYRRLQDLADSKEGGAE